MATVLIRIPVPAKLAGSASDTKKNASSRYRHASAVWMRQLSEEPAAGALDHKAAILTHIPPWLADDGVLLHVMQASFNSVVKTELIRRIDSSKLESVKQSTNTSSESEDDSKFERQSVSAEFRQTGRGVSQARVEFDSSKALKKALSGHAKFSGERDGNKKSRRKTAVCVPEDVADAAYAARTVSEAYATGIAAWLDEYDSVRQPADDLLLEVEMFMDSFDARQAQSKADLEARANVPDNDGFVEVMSRGHKRSGTDQASVRGTTLSVDELTALRDKKSKAQQLSSFYRFQMVREKRDKLANLRKRFEEDKEKIARMRKQRQFRPY